MKQTLLTDTLVFLTYNVRPGTDFPAYEDWLREVDTPFFNSVEPIHYYANWKVIEGFYLLPFSLFDFMTFAEPGDVERAWSEAKLQAFAADWEKQWGNDPGSEDKAANYQVYRYRRLAEASTEGDFVSLAFDQNVGGAVPDGHHAFALAEPMIGPVFGQRLLVGFHADQTAAAGAAAAIGGAVGTPIARP